MRQSIHTQHMVKTWSAFSKTHFQTLLFTIGHSKGSYKTNEDYPPYKFHHRSIFSSSKWS